MGIIEGHHKLSSINLMTYHKPLKTYKKLLKLYHEELGVPKKKLFGGIGTYAKTWIPLPNRKKQKVSISYRDFENLDKIKPDTRLIKVPHPEKKGKYIEMKFINNFAELEKKLTFLKEEGYGGMIIWSINQDVSPTHKKSILKFIHKNN